MTILQDHAYIVFENKLLFSDLQLMSSDGTLDGTTSLVDDSVEGPGVPSRFTLAGDQVYFAGRSNDHGEELWVTDGTSEGTTLVKDMWPGEMGSSVLPIVVHNDLLVFRADHPEFGIEIWTSDGTEDGTLLLQDFNPNNEKKILVTEPQFQVFNDELIMHSMLYSHLDGIQLRKIDVVARTIETISQEESGTFSYFPLDATFSDPNLYFNGRNGWYFGNAEDPTSFHTLGANTRGKIYVGEISSLVSNDAEIALHRLASDTMVLLPDSRGDFVYFGEIDSLHYYAINDFGSTKFYSTDGSIEGTKQWSSNDLSTNTVKHGTVLGDLVLIYTASGGIMSLDIYNTKSKENRQIGLFYELGKLAHAGDEVWFFGDDNSPDALMKIKSDGTISESVDLLYTELYSLDEVLVKPNGDYILFGENGSFGSALYRLSEERLTELAVTNAPINSLDLIDSSVFYTVKESGDENLYQIRDSLPVLIESFAGIQDVAAVDSLLFLIVRDESSRRRLLKWNPLDSVITTIASEGENQVTKILSLTPGDDEVFVIATTLQYGRELYRYRLSQGPITDVNEVLEPIKKRSILYPNPATNEISINSEEGVRGYEIYDLIGNLITKVELEVSKPLVSWRVNVPTGAYIARVNLGNGLVEQHKFLVSR